MVMEHIKNMVRQIKDEENNSRIGIPITLDRFGFKHLAMKVTLYAINLITPEWLAAKEMALKGN
jgi:hypothetical protein